MRWIVSAALACSCGSSGPDAAQVQRDVDQQRAQLRALSCARPVLRGAPLAGPADADIDAVTAEDGSALAACVDRWRPLSTKLYAHCKPVTSECANGPVPDELRGEVDQVIADCGEVAAAAIARATGHAQACTPHPEAEFADLMHQSLRMLELAKLADRAAQALVTSGHAVEGMRRMLDMIALANDWSRGAGGLTAAIISSAMIRITVLDARAALRELAPGELAEIADEVNRAVAGLPPIYGTLMSDALATITRVLREDPAHAGRAWRVFEDTQDRFEAACPADATMGSCVTALTALPRLDANDAMPEFATIVRNIAVAHASVHELALEVAVRQLGHCPTDADWASPPLAARLAPPTLGITMTATAEPGGVWRIDAPSSVSRKLDAPLTLGRITCE